VTFILSRESWKSLFHMRRRKRHPQNAGMGHCSFNQRMAVDDEIRELTAQLKGRDHFRAAPITARRSAKIGPQSAAARKAVSLRMKAYWAARRKSQATKTAPAKATRRTMTSAARKAISEKMKITWAKRKAQAVKAAAPKKSAPAKTGERTMSAAAKKAISQKLKLAWAKRKAEAGKSK